MKLWKVQLLYEMVVRAASVGEAKTSAIDAVQDPMFDTEPEATTPVRVSTLSDLPPGWDGSCRPWGERDPKDRTIAEQLEAAVPAQGATEGSSPNAANQARSDSK